MKKPTPRQLRSQANWLMLRTWREWDSLSSATKAEYEKAIEDKRNLASEIEMKEGTYGKGTN